jgi:hypothetical protein
MSEQDLVSTQGGNLICMTGSDLIQSRKLFPKKLSSTETEASRKTRTEQWIQQDENTHVQFLSSTPLRVLNRLIVTNDYVSKD